MSRAYDDLMKLNEMGLLETLLIDRTSGKNILWATDSYEEFGITKDSEVQLGDLVSGIVPIKYRFNKNTNLINNRKKKYAEVFTPYNIVLLMNNYVDNEYFGVNDISEYERLPFDNNCKFADYVTSRRMEITCGEAPFLTTRYDPVTGEHVEISRRAGILDRKIRAINENVDNKYEWLKWAIVACQSCYGYEYQGDNLLLSRMNMVNSFCEEFRNRWNNEPDMESITKVCEVVSWNLWQMDGLTGRNLYGQECVIRDWAENGEKTYVRFCEVRAGNE